MKKTCLIALLLWSGAAAELPSTPTPIQLREQSENALWAPEILQYARTRPAPVRQALEQIVRDAEAMARLDPHKAHDALLVTRDKILRVKAHPELAERERLDSPVSNFGVVKEGALLRGAQPSPAGLRWLHDQEHVGTVLVLREPGVEETNYPDWTRKAYLEEIRKLGMHPVEIEIKDRTVPTPEQIDEFLKSVRDSGQVCYVHCSAGVGRTGIMAGLYERMNGVEPALVIEHNRRFHLDPSQYADHALQASLVANYPLPGHEEQYDVRWSNAPAVASPVQLDLDQGKGWVLRPETTLRLIPEQPMPAMERLAQVLRDGSFVRLDFGSLREIKILASMARVVPKHQKLGSLALRELCFGGESCATNLEDLRLARRLLGPAPFEVRASGLTRQDLTPERVAQIAQLVKGEAEIVDLNLPNGENPPREVIQQLARAGLACTVRLSQADSGSR